MYRPQFSYWLEAYPEKGYEQEHNKVLKTLYKNDVTNDTGCLIAEWDEENKRITAEVDPKEGTIPWTQRLPEMITKTASKFPNWIFKFEQYNEEDKSDRIIDVYENGKKIRPSISDLESLLGEKDIPTMAYIVQSLRKTKMDEAADFVENQIWQTI